jgi:hypothetical protein
MQTLSFHIAVMYPVMYDLATLAALDDHEQDETPLAVSRVFCIVIFKHPV